MTIQANTFGFYNTGYHFMFYCLISVHTCLLTDLTPLQKKPFSDLNFLIASCAAAIIPTVVTNIVVFESFTREVSMGVGLAIASGLLITLTIQHVFDGDIYF